ncbi:hypothetical protein Mterra_01081 [Calidithermus terrae]|uniref:TTHB210-like domain-containing protein n=1 Tax=Calidithermus terrae TaxID=1408545 RepID=A0A399EV75_9DEIN|nr:DUF5602 domain-containing protein [Calidithermus terrae]RIH87948.1 hypothetical protein Mterra_01081 [Calidithermus terrae]
MKRWIGVLAVLAALGIGVVLAQNVMKAPPMGPYVNVSEALKGALPNFIPGLGTLYVDPKNLPEGPFLAYDRAGRLVKVVFMVPLEELGKKKYVDIGTAALKGLGVTAKVDHVNIIPSPPHPGVEKPHVHFELVLVSLEQEKKVLEGEPY